MNAQSDILAGFTIDGQPVTTAYLDFRIPRCSICSAKSPAAAFGVFIPNDAYTKQLPENANHFVYRVCSQCLVLGEDVIKAEIEEAVLDAARRVLLATAVGGSLRAHQA